MNKIKITNPDVKKIYDVWHFCKVCKKVYTHSQSDWEQMKHKCCGYKENLLTFSTEIDEVEIEIEDNEITKIKTKIIFE